MLKAILTCVLCLTAFQSQAAGTILRQTRPDGTIDRARPAWQVDQNGVVTQLRSDGTPDRSKPRYKIEGNNKMYELRSDGTVDYPKSVPIPREK